MTDEKPPIGLRPQSVHNKQVDQDRAAEIIAAMLRYADVKKPIPETWIYELQYLVTQRKIRYALEAMFPGGEGGPGSPGEPLLVLSQRKKDPGIRWRWTPPFSYEERIEQLKDIIHALTYGRIIPGTFLDNLRPDLRELLNDIIKEKHNGH